MQSATTGSRCGLLCADRAARAFGAPCARHAERRSVGMTGRLRVSCQAATLERKAEAPGISNTAWGQHELSQKYPTLHEDQTADTVVVGAGLAGLSVAYHLAKAGQKVVVLESRFRGSGQTGKSSGHLMGWNDDFYFELERTHGLDRAKQAAEAQRAACLLVGQIAEEEGFDCKYQRNGGFLYPDSGANAAHGLLNNDQFDKEVDAVQRLGLPGVHKVDLGGGPEVGGITTALSFPESADFQPLLYLEGLADAITRHGGKVYENSPVKSANGKEVTTKQGFTVTAPNVVLATNSPIHRNLTVHSRQVASRTYLLGLKIPEDAIKPAQYWDTAMPYHSVRTEHHPEHGLLLIVGGANHQAGLKTEDYPDSYGELEQFARARWPKAGDVVFKWTGLVYQPGDQLPLYGQDPLNDFQQGAVYYVATGDSGQGGTGGTIGGLVISSQILGKPHPWSDMVSPSRAPPPSLPQLSQLATYGATIISSASGLVRPELRPTDISDLSAGEGNVLQRGAQKYAVYKDEGGQVHTFSPVCPHLGCVVQWDPAEKSFDCPCHGSQFSGRGEVINGPANENLAPVEVGTFGVEEKPKEQ